VFIYFFKKGEGDKHSPLNLNKANLFKDIKMTPQDTLRDTVERLIAKIEAGTGEWIKPFNSSFPSNYSNKAHYQGINILNLWNIAEEKGYSSNSWVTYNQVKALNAHVKAGEKASPVFFLNRLTLKSWMNQDWKQLKRFLCSKYTTFSIWIKPHWKLKRIVMKKLWRSKIL
jgi:antirestriction protein ArdC